MIKSMGLRLQLWYAAVLLLVIGGLSGGLYYQVRTSRLNEIDTRIKATAIGLATAVRGLPPHTFEGGPPPPRPPRRPDQRPRPDQDGPPPGHPPGAPDEVRNPHEPGPPRGEPGWFGDGPGPPFGLGPRPDVPAEDRLMAAMSAWERPEPPQDRPYFAVWRADGSLLAASPQHEIGPRPETFVEQRNDRDGLRWERPDRREALLAGPRGTLILVGKPVGRELDELRRFAWQIGASGLAVLAFGLAGGWLIARSIDRPIASIARTASEISATNLARRIDTEPIDRELVGLATVLNDMFARHEGAFERQSRFTSDASHELRTPLAVIHSHAELALSKPRSSEEYRETLTACLKAASRMASLVDGLLTLARADSGHLDAQFRTVDLRSVVQEVVEQYRPQAEGAQIALSAALSEPASVHGDPALLARISSNLLSNALRYTPPGGTIHVSLHGSKSGAMLVVEDSGCGIPLEDQPRVFERFFRADRSRSRTLGGNGLGLAICKTLVEAHGGRIGFSSTPDRGTRFEVEVPGAVEGG